ncbi:hypothetical protein [Pantoea eucalypti]|uniref:hypothetical protein n=1 Tax=Pantoea eucalypti TaxID=470933 RepID=UPI00099A8E79|nr:hypothetical protein [Pantoea eucalypti]SJZ72842.1 hypothetical protein SAMN03097723_1933 [Pantoea eucalypti]
MISQNKAVEIAKEYARETGYGWDERFHEAVRASFDGKSVWVISTSDLKFSEDLPWMMESMPNPVKYYIDVSSGECIAVGGKGSAILRLNK